MSIDIAIRVLLTHLIYVLYFDYDTARIFDSAAFLFYYLNG